MFLVSAAVLFPNSQTIQNSRWRRNMTLKLHQLGRGEGGADSESLPHLFLPSTRHIILQIIYTDPIPTQVVFTINLISY
jgi:hypothetical protein